MSKIVILLLCALLFLAFGNDTATKCPDPTPEAGKCKCAAVVRPVCGVSGETHINRCVANCFKDPVLHIGHCHKHCPRTESQKVNCSFKRYGKFGIRKFCCAHEKICFGKNCASAYYRCRFQGPPINRFPRNHCSWERTGKGEKQRKCCHWTRVCNGRVCTNTKKVCNYVGEKLVSKVINNCEMRRAPGCDGGMGIQKYCCEQKRKCLDKTCNVEEKRCHWVGPITRIKQTEDCSWVKVKVSGQTGSRRRCCLTTRNCVDTTCKVSKRECHYTGWTVFKRTVHKCALRKYRRGQRKRCCTWALNCFNGKCTVTDSKCQWTGPYETLTQKKFCRKIRVGDFFQHSCCTMQRRCKNGKCVDFNKKCQSKGPLFIISKIYKCSHVKVSGGYRRKCCETRRYCTNKGDCKDSTPTCTYRGGLITQKTRETCSIKDLGKHRSCKWCCSWASTCEQGQCRDGKRSCKCVGETRVTLPKSDCKIVKIDKNRSRRQCCDWKNICQGEKCHNTKKRCHYVGFPIVTRTVRNCIVKKHENARQLYCCVNTTVCEGPRCQKTKNCKWTGSLMVDINRKKCSVKKYMQAGRRKHCCTWVDRCTGPKCQKIRFKCFWTGPLMIAKKIVTKVLKPCGTLKGSQKRFRCVSRQYCLKDSKGKVDSCKQYYYKCTPVSECILIEKKHSSAMVKIGVRVWQRRDCDWIVKCVNGHCQPHQKHCKQVGPMKTIRITRRCRAKKLSPKTARTYCCTRTTTCYGNDCKSVNSKCRFTGPVESLHDKQVCVMRKVRAKEADGKCGAVQLKKVCCMLRSKCVNGNCVAFSRRCKIHKFHYTRLHKKKCSWRYLRPPSSDLILKRRCCDNWEVMCYKGICQKQNVHTTCSDKLMRITHTRSCHFKYFGKNRKRHHCCKRTKVCFNGKCHSQIHDCHWVGKSFPCVKGNVIYRWRNVCSPKRIYKYLYRTRCCKTYERCEQIRGGNFRCQDIQRVKCWYKGSDKLLQWGRRVSTKKLAAQGAFQFVNAENFNVYILLKNVNKNHTLISQVAFVSGNDTIVVNAGKISENGKEVKQFPVKFGVGSLEQDTRNAKKFHLKGFDSWFAMQDDNDELTFGIANPPKDAQGLFDQPQDLDKWKVSDALSHSLFGVVVKHANLKAKKIQLAHGHEVKKTDAVPLGQHSDQKKASSNSTTTSSSAAHDTSKVTKTTTTGGSGSSSNHSVVKDSSIQITA